jgi:cytochrome c556
MNISSKMLVTLLGAFAVSGACFAQDAASSSSTHSMGSMSGMHGNMSGMHHVQGMHKMPATVSSVDTKTGLVEADAEGMSLKVHFPPAAVADLKAGDKITLHMGYTKP